MKKIVVFTLVSLFALPLTSGCTEKQPASDAAPAVTVSQAAAPAAMAPAANGKTGTVKESINTAGYTYVQVDTGSEIFWAAAPQFLVKAGDTVLVPEGMPMQNYHSKSLNRDFDLVYFVGGIMVQGGSAALNGADALPPGHPPMNGAPAAPAAAAQEIDLANIAKAEGGQTIAEIFAAPAELSGKEVVVRGKVVKFSANIMGKSWIHLQDGTGSQGSDDLTITTLSSANVGDTVLVKGILSTNKDFGAGYKYEVIIEDANVVVE